MEKGFKLLSSLALIGALGATVSFAATESALDKVMKEKGLSEADVVRAAKTYNPTGVHDKYLVFSSGGQSGQIMVYGVPSMRLLKYIGVFTPEPWQGYGFDEESKKVLAQGKIRGKDITWGDTHHPSLSETDAKVDGKWLVVNDKANPRIAVIDLHDFETKQIVVNPVFKSEHGGSFFTQDSEWIIEAAQYAAPFDNDYHPIEDYKETYRGGVTMWKFDPKKGRIQEKDSYTIELPPYMQDLSDAGKKVSHGWGFTNSFNSEMYTGGIEVGMPPNEAGMSRNDTDYLHVYNWQKLAELAKDPKNVKIVNNHRVVPMDIAIKNDALFLIPEPKSPHGVDVDPTGEYIVVCGKLDTHASVYSFSKIQNLIKNKEYAGKDPYGIPILDMKKALHGQVELGLGPLHNQYSNVDGEIYTSLYVDSQVVKWNFKTLKVLDRVNVHYNIGHLCGMESNTADPQGDYIIALNKLSIDRFNNVGPLHPQNHQLIDIRGGKMDMLVDMPIPLGEPHDAVAIRASKLNPEVRYEMGTNTRTNTVHEGKTLAGQERIERNGSDVKVYATLVRSHINPERITVNKGDNVTFYVTNLERAEDETHGFTIDNYNVHASVEPGKTSSIKFKADMEGVFPYYCTEFCSALHLEMMGYLMVKDPNKKYDSVQKLKMASMSKEQLKAEYDKTVATNKATDDVIQSVVKFLKDNHYEKHDVVKNLVNDALDQYGKIAEQKKLSDAAVKEGDLEKAVLFENMIWQYMVKTADVGIRAKDLLVKFVATKQSPAAAKGETAFNEGGCSGCHVIGKVSSGPDLTGVLGRHENGEKWVAEFIKDPKPKFDEPYVKAMIDFFNLRMPNQNMKDEEVKNIIEYLKWVDSNANLF
ncbi:MULTISPECIES: Sec-dependent nitrous-oxide reductase [Sulfurospirillum]|jgi:nitrous-oxide reductase|uniref:Sec-dependent nitrous-oxide reductase n=1 Tax=Sulfurospirillum TaxID=57665 RepID=UPI0007648B2F|nr:MULTISPECIES: Sec-dependent nitrous-oxide reductase [Sulfurospirillum]MCP3651660.1 Sec-dependent nitrous-oxide reductase [Sulfurospirillum sp. DNRA8]MCR1810507.1 Sec-dependent nitrous-oxide reductase [Sulfurospirillum sp. DNRA8]